MSQYLTNPTEAEIEVAREIGFYYLAKCGGSDFGKCEKLISELQITAIKVDQVTGTASIHLSRPGLIIGWHGVNLNNLVSYLCDRIKWLEHVVICEDKNINDYIIPQYPDID